MFLRVVVYGLLVFSIAVSFLFQEKLAETYHQFTHKTPVFVFSPWTSGCGESWGSHREFSIFTGGCQSIIQTDPQVLGHLKTYLQIEPKVAGRFESRYNGGLQFFPDPSGPGWAQGVTYKVHLRVPLIYVDSIFGQGQKMILEPFEWSFTLPEVTLEVVPGPIVRLDHKTKTFSQQFRLKSNYLFSSSIDSLLLEGSSGAIVESFVYNEITVSGIRPGLAPKMIIQPNFFKDKISSEIPPLSLSIADSNEVMMRFEDEEKKLKSRLSIQRWVNREIDSGELVDNPHEKLNQLIEIWKTRETKGYKFSSTCSSSSETIQVEVRGGRIVSTSGTPGVDVFSLKDLLIKVQTATSIEDTTYNRISVSFEANTDNVSDVYLSQSKEQGGNNFYCFIEDIKPAK